jgi:secretion/DNA translocation related TadE-like protein
MMSARRTGRRAAGQVAVTAVRANRTDERGGDSGLATVWAATAVAVVIGVLVAMLDLAAAVGARHRAEAAADLAALAAAGQAVRGAESACDRADAAAEGTGGRVVLCRVQGWNADVEVEVGVRLSMLGTVTVHGRARAGPVVSAPTEPTSIPSAGNDHAERSMYADERTETGQCNELHAYRRLPCTDRPRTVRSPWKGHRSATVAGMGRPAGAY